MNLNRVRQIMLRKIWLPKALYSALPAIYICLGIYATYTALFLLHWSWVVPYFLILACICLHAGVFTATLRIRAYKRFQTRPKAIKAGRLPPPE
jgi:hypothetical protein